MTSTPRLCSCGSGECQRPLYDGHRIFLAYVCDACEASTLDDYRSDIMEAYDCDEPIDSD